MFHRAKAEPEKNTQAAPAPAQAPQPQQQSFIPQNPAAVQQVSSKEEIRMNDARPAQEAKPEQNNQSRPQASQPQPAPSQPAPKKEEPKMNEPAKKAETPQENAPRALDIPGNAYQRPGQPPVRAGGTFPGAYPGYNPHTPAAGAVSTDRRLIIGRGITMSGEIESCDHLIVEGTVEATLKGASVLDIAESGVFYGTVEIQEATVAGRFEGDIQVAGRLTIRTGGVIIGSISYKELEVEAGATIDGRLSPISGSQLDKKGQPGKKHKKEQNDAANSDDGLFSKQAAE